MSDHPTEALRPRDLALLLLASGDLRPRRRARDQQADTAGLGLKQHILEHLVDLDPEPADLEATLLRIVEGMGPPPGPARAVAAVVRDEWRSACACPEWVAHLLAEVAGAAGRDREGGRRGSLS